jgi:glucosamine--fructose-6-phosphate aminotransferase (isomerizing)
MCGIVGYIGSQDAKYFLLGGLRRLEYRGYDSSGIATVNDAGDLLLTKTVGRIDNLAGELTSHPVDGKLGIGHTRWATHGPATQPNAHPHIGGNESLAIAHNGVIENYLQIKQRLESEGVVFNSATDSEVIAQLISGYLEGSEDIVDPSVSDPVHGRLVGAVKKALSQLRGTYGLVVVFHNHPELLIAARLGSPLVIGVGEGEHFIASDASPLFGGSPSRNRDG